MHCVCSETHTHTHTQTSLQICHREQPRHALCDTTLTYCTHTCMQSHTHTHTCTLFILSDFRNMRLAWKMLPPHSSHEEQPKKRGRKKMEGGGRESVLLWLCPGGLPPLSVSRSVARSLLNMWVSRDFCSSLVSRSEWEAFREWQKSLFFYSLFSF